MSTLLLVSVSMSASTYVSMSMIVSILFRQVGLGAPLAGSLEHLHLGVVEMVVVLVGVTMVMVSVVFVGVTMVTVSVFSVGTAVSAGRVGEKQQQRGSNRQQQQARAAHFSPSGGGNTKEITFSLSYLIKKIPQMQK